MEYITPKSGLLYCGRLVVKIVFNNGTFQPFYRSTGVHSKKKDTYLPFDGVSFVPYPWFNKIRFVRSEKVPESLHRYGCEYLYEVSKSLQNLEVTDVVEILDPQDINKFLFGLLLEEKDLLFKF